jgi:hypothetical protein
LKLKIGFEQAKSAQEFQILATVVSGIFGGKKKTQKPPESFAEASAAFSSVFGKKMG